MIFYSVENIWLKSENVFLEESGNELLVFELLNERLANKSHLWAYRNELHAAHAPSDDRICRTAVSDSRWIQKALKRIVDAYDD